MRIQNMVLVRFFIGVFIFLTNETVKVLFSSCKYKYFFNKLLKQINKHRRYFEEFENIFKETF